MTPKNISIIYRNDKDQLINNALHFIDLFDNIKTKHFQIKDECVKADIKFAFHSFTNFNKWSEIVENNNVFVFPTEKTDDETMRVTFNHPNIAKIIVASDSYVKYFTKTLGLPTSRVKLINMPASPTKFGMLAPTGQKIILTPCLVSPNMDFIELLNAIKELKLKYKNLIYILILTNHPYVSVIEENAIIQKIINHIIANDLRGQVKLITNPQYDLDYYLKLTDIVLLPYDSSAQMYNNTLVDSIVAKKPIVAPNLPHIHDFCKKGAGIFLFQNTNMSSIVDACSVILDHNEIKTILQEQNAELSPQFSHSIIAQQYINLFKRFKE